MSESEDILQAKDIPVFGGKPFAGVIVNARPFLEWWPRCLVGFLAGKDHLQRGFDNSEIRTSPVEKLVIENDNIYAITKNSAYRLESVDLMSFLSCSEWVNDIDNLITQFVSANKESKID